MKISVIVPVYNTEAYLARCIDSILSQTLGEIELILVNDGSTDNSQRVIDDYKTAYPERIQTLSVDNGGQGRARNFGLELAGGEYVGFVDSDDWIDGQMYEKLYWAAEKQHADIAMCDFLSVFADGNTRYEEQRLNERPVSAAGSACNKLFRRELIDTERFPVGLWYEDFSFSAKLLTKAKKIAYLAEPLYLYRCGHSSTMHNGNAAKNLDIIEIMEELKTFLGDGKRDDFEYLLLNHVLLESIKRVSAQKDSGKRETVKKLREYVRRHIPRLCNCGSFKQESRNRRIIMFFNYYGLHELSKLLLRIQSIVKR